MTANSGRIHQAHRHTVDRDALLNRIARRARNLGNDGAFRAEQGVEQRGFPGVRRPDDRDGDAVADETAELAVAQQFAQAPAHYTELLQQRARSGSGPLRGKSIDASNCVDHFRNLSRMAAISCTRALSKFANAARAAALVSRVDQIGDGGRFRSAILPLRKARCVNSPVRPDARRTPASPGRRPERRRANRAAGVPACLRRYSCAAPENRARSHGRAHARAHRIPSHRRGAGPQCRRTGNHRATDLFDARNRSHARSQWRPFPAASRQRRSSLAAVAVHVLVERALSEEKSPRGVRALHLRIPCARRRILPMSGERSCVRMAASVQVFAALAGVRNARASASLNV